MSLKGISYFFFPSLSDFGILLSTTMKKSKLFLDILRLPVDYLAIFAALLMAYKIRPITDLIPGVQYHFTLDQLPVFSEYLKFSLVSALFLVLLFAYNGLYSINSAERLSHVTLKIIFLVSAWLMFIIAYYALVLHQLFFSRITLAHIWLFAILFVFLGRLFLRLLEYFLYRFGILRTRLLFIGLNEFADESFEILKKDRKYEIVGALAEKIESRKKGALKIVGTFSDLGTVVKKYSVDEVIQFEANLAGLRPDELLTFCRSHHLHYYFVPDILKLQSTNVEMEMLDGIPFISLKQTRLEGWGRVSKRLFDFFASLILILLFLPFALIIALLIKLDSKGSVFYGSIRKYKNRTFKAYKFRSMIQDADSKRATLLNKNERKGPLFKIRNDPRVTRVGRFLRKTSLDEFPQLINVFLGQMSLVGPRPHLPEEVAQYESEHLRVFALKPGITGLAQINGRSNLDFEDELKFDFYYIENWSLWLDLKILIQTVGVLFRADGH